jgi:hypothetical protein
MKESERLRIEARQAGNDLAALGKYVKVLRQERKEKFEETWLEKLQEQTEVIKRDNGSYTFDSKYGVIDFFPKANKLLIRKQNKWKKPALKFIVRNILNGG